MPTEAGGSRSTPKALSDVIEDLGAGWAHVRVLLLGGSVWLADGSELLLIGAVTRAVAVDWELGPSARGFLVSLVFIGVFLGNLASGWLGDSIGRRIPIVASYLLVGVMSLGSACSLGFWTLAMFRVAVGFAFGIGQPSWNSLATELTPMNWRMMMNGTANMLFIVGEMYAGMLVWWADPEMIVLDWRWLLACGAIPSIVIGFMAMLFLWESPSFLACRGYHDQAKDVLRNMRHFNGCHDVPIDFKPPMVVGPSNGAYDGFARQLSIVFGPKMIYSTITVCYSCFVLNFIMYGCLYSMPQVLPKVNMGVSPALGLVVGCLWEVPGIILGICLGMSMARKSAMLFYLSTCGGALLLFAYAGGVAERNQGVELLFQAGYFGVKAFAACGFIIVYQFASEIYPTAARTTGSAVCIAGGRVGSITCPIIFEQVQAYFGSFEVFYYMMAVCCAVNFMAVFFMQAGMENMKEESSPALQDQSPHLQKKAMETDYLLASVRAKV